MVKLTSSRVRPPRSVPYSISTLPPCPPVDRYIYLVVDRTVLDIFPSSFADGTSSFAGHWFYTFTLSNQRVREERKGWRYFINWFLVNGSLILWARGDVDVAVSKKGTTVQIEKKWEGFSVLKFRLFLLLLMRSSLLSSFFSHYFQLIVAILRSKKVMKEEEDEEKKVEIAAAKRRGRRRSEVLRITCSAVCSAFFFFFFKLLLLISIHLLPILSFVTRCTQRRSMYVKSV